VQIKFLDDTTVTVTVKLAWEDKRPANPVVVRKESVVADFSAENPLYIVKDIKGPSKICNFRREEDSRGEWTLRVEKKRKTTAKKTTAKKTTATAKKTTATAKKTTAKKAAIAKPVSAEANKKEV
tara:strand:- start:64879 stop:65253 length:375 start_codon:yes stop_codon:yes gene_type:complete